MERLVGRDSGFMKFIAEQRDCFVPRNDADISMSLLENKN
jgi:hypothetical protein